MNVCTWLILLSPYTDTPLLLLLLLLPPPSPALPSSGSFTFGYNFVPTYRPYPPSFSLPLSSLPPPSSPSLSPTPRICDFIPPFPTLISSMHRAGCCVKCEPVYSVTTLQGPHRWDLLALPICLYY